MTGYVQDDVSEEEVERQKQLYGPFTQAVRELVDATIRTTVDDEEILAVQVEDGTVELRLEGDGDVSLARWAAQRQGDVFERTFERELSVL